MTDNIPSRAEIATSWKLLPQTPDTKDQAELAEQRARRYRPNLLKKTAAWASVGFGTFTLMVSLFDPQEDGLRWLAGSLILSVMVALPGAYWLWNNHRDVRTLENWISAHRSQEELSQLLVGAEKNLVGPPPNLPLLPKRRWAVVALVCFVLVVVGGSLLPTG